MKKKFQLKLPNGETVEIVMEPIKRVDMLREIIPAPFNEKFEELKFLCNLKLCPFIMKNCDAIFKHRQARS